MYQIINILVLWIFTWFVIIHPHHGFPSVKMEVTLNANFMTLSCFVTNRDPNKNIYLLCPLVPNELNCLENCISSCQDDDCSIDRFINCQNKGFDPYLSTFRIDYIIDGTNMENNGKWQCLYGGESSSVIHVNASTAKRSFTKVFNSSAKPLSKTINKPNISQKPQKNETLAEEIARASGPSPSLKDDITSSNHNNIFLTKKEFIIAVVGLLALSLIFNIFFCCRMIIIHCRLKKTTNNSLQYLSMHSKNPPCNRSNSQVSDSERIYEDTSMNPRHLPLSQIKVANGNYFTPTTLTPTSEFPTLLPHRPFYPPLSVLSSTGDNSGQPINIPFLMDPLQTKYATVNFPNESNYTNFVSVPQEMCLRDGNNIPQPVYLALQTTSPMMTPTDRYVCYGNQPLQSVSTMSRENRTTTKGPQTSNFNLPHANNTISRNNSEEGKSNYQLSREMLEEADNLLRTADTLLKSTDNGIKLYNQ